MSVCVCVCVCARAFVRVWVRVRLHVCVCVAAEPGLLRGEQHGAAAEPACGGRGGQSVYERH